MGMYDRMAGAGGQVMQHGVMPIIGIKGGKDGWMQHAFGMDIGRPGTMPGLRSAFREGGFMGAGARAKSWLGVGFGQTKIGEAGRYLETLSGYQGTKFAPEMLGKRAGALRQATRAFRYRQYGTAAAGVGGMMLASRTVGLGNMAWMGGGYLGGAAVGGAVGHALAARGAGGVGAGAMGAAAGRRWGGRAGAAAMGLGLLTGVI